MRLPTLVRRGLTHHWRTNLAVVAGVATAVSVLTGALLVGESVRASLRNLVLQRLGNAELAVSSSNPFREELAEAFGSACPLIAFDALVTHRESGRRASGVAVYGVDGRFWRFHGVRRQGPQNPRALLSESLARELGGRQGDAILVRIEKPSHIPAESLHGRKEDAGQTIRFSFVGVQAPSELGEFSLRPQQGAVRAVFVSLARLQQQLNQPGKANTILLGRSPGKADETLRRNFTLEDVGIRVRVIAGQNCLQLETASGIVGDALADTARAVGSRLGMQNQGVLTYLANSMKAGEREIPYSLVTAIDLDKVQTSGRLRTPVSPVLLNDWAARDLGANLGDKLSLEYYLWRDDGRLVTETSQFEVAGVVPIEGLAADREFAPEYPGITDAEHVNNWDPPFPLDLSRIRDKDEEYWERYRTTPKAFVPLERGQQLWQSRYGKLTSLRLTPADGSDLPAARDAFEKALRSEIDPFQMGFTLLPVRDQSLYASRGATDFGEYFVYFSFFLMVSALLLAGLFFRLGVEQRVREIGLLEAAGFRDATIRNLFLGEGVVLGLVGSLLGIAGAGLYAGLILLGLRTWWIDAVGTRLITLHVTPEPLVAGGAGGALVALLSIAWTLRGLRRASPRSLLSGEIAGPGGRFAGPPRAIVAGAVCAISGLALLLAGGFQLLPQVAGFFGAGTLMLIAGLAWLRALFSRPGGRTIAGAGVPAVSRLGFRNASHRPGRTVLSIALIASATFIIVSVDAFRREGTAPSLEVNSGSGGYPLMAESLLPLYHNPATDSGRENLNLQNAEGATFVPFRLRPGDDVSCLNLYQPRNPRILAPTGDFLRSGRFRFQSSLAQTPEENKNPWLLLDSAPEDGSIPAIVDANSMTYVLHKKLGDQVVMAGAGGSPIRLRLVAALSDSIFQSELIISEKNFLRLFTGQQGYRFFLLGAPPERIEKSVAEIERALADYGFDIVSTEERLAGFHRVENTYLSTFQTLGALGLVLGTVGLAAVLLRNVLERRKELALLRAVGYRPGHLALMVVAENFLLLGCGLAVGTLTALLAIVPALAERGGSLSVSSLVLLLLIVLVTGLLASVLATSAALRAPLLSSLRSE